MANSFSGGRGRSTQREPLTMSKQLVNFSLAVASRVLPFCNLESRARTHGVLVIVLYDLLGKLIEPLGSLFVLVPSFTLNLTVNRRKTDNTKVKRKGTNNDLQNIT